MKDKRKHKRFPTGLQAEYVTNSSHRGDCRIVDISIEGMSVELILKEKIDIGPDINLEIFFPKQDEPIEAGVNIRWVSKISTQDDYNYAAGGVIMNIDGNDKRCLLEYAYDNWFRTV